MILCTFLFLLWLILNGRVTVEICLLGLVISVGLCIFCAKALGYDPRREKGLIKRLGLYIVYTFVLIWEILKASVGVMKIVLAPRMHYHPAIVRLEVPLKKRGFPGLFVQFHYPHARHRHGGGARGRVSCPVPGQRQCRQYGALASR